MQGWTTQQVYRLCQMLDLTEFELSRLCAVEWGTWRGWVKANHFPSYMALRFTEWNSWYFEQRTGIGQAPIVPVHLFVKPDHAA